MTKIYVKDSILEIGIKEILFRLENSLFLWIPFDFTSEVKNFIQKTHFISPEVIYINGSANKNIYTNFPINYVWLMSVF